jgi:hypothetical protein
MAWKLKKEHENTTISSINKPLKDLNQNQINKLKEDIKNCYFIEEKPKKKKNSGLDS